MTLGYTDGKTKIKIFLLIFILTGVSTVTLFELRKVISGPKLVLECNNTINQCDNIKSDKNIYTLNGKTRNVSTIYIGNRKIYLDTNGYFKEEILLYPGNNLISIKSFDRFGKEVKKDINIYYNQLLTAK